MLLSKYSTLSQSFILYNQGEKRQPFYSLRHFYNRLFPHSLPVSNTFSIHRISQKTSQKKVCIFIFQSFDSCPSFLIFEIFDPLFSRNSWIPNSSSFFLLLDSVTSFIVNFFPHSNIPPPIKCDQWYFLIHSLYATATTPAPWPPPSPFVFVAFSFRRLYAAKWHNFDGRL